MRTIEQSTQFRRDYKREVKISGRTALEAFVRPVVSMLVADLPLPERLRDHGLTGEWRGFRDCHIRPDLVLIYRKVGDDILELRRMGSHSELRL